MPEATENNSLTEKKYWDDYWDHYTLPCEIKRSGHSLFLNELLNVFDKYLPENHNMNALEIGGAPGQYLAYMHRKFGYRISSLDYSETGCELTRENFKLLNIKGDVYFGDLFSDDLSLPHFDFVYSLGFIEHFTDAHAVIKRHLQFLKPGGILMLGVPNLQGINEFFLKRLAPAMLSTHNLDIMNIASWDEFEKEFELTKLFRGYIGGFEPSIFCRIENQSSYNKKLYSFAKKIDGLLHRRYKSIRKFNTRFSSGYAIGIYKKGS